jgi:hypothetical protein
MHRLSAVCLILTYVIVFLNTSASVARASGSSKITVSHSVHDSHAGDPKPCPKPHQHQHSHELAIGGHAAHTTHSQNLNDVILFAQPRSFAITHERAESAPSLHGIFRPPIA